MNTEPFPPPLTVQLSAGVDIEQGGAWAFPDPDGIPVLGAEDAVRIA